MVSSWKTWVFTVFSTLEVLPALFLRLQVFWDKTLRYWANSSVSTEPIAFTFKGQTIPEHCLKLQCVCQCIYARRQYITLHLYTGCFTTCGRYCRKWFPRSLWSKSSYKHVSDFGRLRSYGHFLILVHVLVWTASYGTSWRVMYSTWWLIFCVVSIIFATWLTQFTTERQPLLAAGFKHRSIQIKGNFTKLTLHL
jgi:hypothetical protein